MCIPEMPVPVFVQVENKLQEPEDGKKEVFFTLLCTYNSYLKKLKFEKYLFHGARWIVLRENFIII